MYIHAFIYAVGWSFCNELAPSYQTFVELNYPKFALRLLDDTKSIEQWAAINRLLEIEIPWSLYLPLTFQRTRARFNWHVAFHHRHQSIVKYINRLDLFK
jgi:hypothetical protein